MHQKYSGEKINFNYIYNKIREVYGKKELPLTGFFNIYYYTILKDKRPVLVYQMGKVGSSTVWDSLRYYGIKPVFHLHLLNPPVNSYGKRINRYIISKSRKADLITLVRNPIARIISGFQGYISRNLNSSMEELNKKFLELTSSDHPSFRWFDWEMKPVTGIDVFKTRFPKKKGWQIIEKDDYRLLIVKLELEDKLIEESIQKFLDLNPDFQLVRSNVTTKKEFGDIYDKFKKQLKLPKDYLDMMLNSKYCKHFYTKGEIDNIRKKYDI